MSVTPPASVKAALVALLEAVPALSGVTFYVSPQSADIIDREHVILGDVKGRHNPHSMGYTYLSEYDIEGEAVLHKPAKTEAVDRAWVLLSNVADTAASNWTVSGNTLDAELTEWEIEETVDPSGKGWQSRVEFTLSIKDLSA